ncbi:MAG: hypothetical protein E6559_21525, partial [Pantoea sp.]|nr:hypothetical protein [Pantoea sp.]
MAGAGPDLLRLQQRPDRRGAGC